MKISLLACVFCFAMLSVLPQALGAGKSVTGTQALPYTCTDDTKGNRTCSCEGIIDCDKMRGADVCKKNTTICEPSYCICGWKKSTRSPTLKLPLSPKAREFKSSPKVRKFETR